MIALLIIVILLNIDFLEAEWFIIVHQIDYYGAKVPNAYLRLFLLIHIDTSRGQVAEHQLLRGDENLLWRMVRTSGQQ